MEVEGPLARWQVAGPLAARSGASESSPGGGDQKLIARSLGREIDFRLAAPLGIWALGAEQAALAEKECVVLSVEEATADLTVAARDYARTGTRQR